MSKKGIRFLLVLAAGIVLSGKPAGAAGLEPDIVIYNGKILTADSPDPNNFTIAQAAAIHNGKFIAVGTNEEVLPYAGASTRKINLGGRTVIPGLVETHDHIYGYASHFFPQGRAQVGELDPPLVWTNKQEGLAQLRTLALRKKPGEWINTSIRGSGPGGGGGTEGMAAALELLKGELTRFDLDTVTPNNPVRLLILFSGTSDSLVNTKALEPLLAKHPNIPGVQRDARGVPTGRLSGVANMTLAYQFWPQISPEDLGPYYKMEMEEVAAQGLTTVSTRLAPNELAAYAWLHARGELPIRMAYSLEAASRSEDPEGAVSRLVGLQGGSGKNMWGVGDDKLWIVGLTPISIDISVGGAGSCVNKSYPREVKNFPLWLHQVYGPNGLCRLVDPNYRDAELIRAAAKYGFRISAMHTAGDRAVDQFLDLTEELSKQYPDIPERRWAIDHCVMVHEQQVVRAKKFNIMFSCGPKYLYDGERSAVGAVKAIYGEEIAADINIPFRRFLNHGVRVTMELDEHAFHPFLALEVAVTRKDVTGKVWAPQQRINRREALYTYTRWSAEYVLKENLLGSIEPSKAADFVVLNRDYLTVPEDEIGQMDPVLTVVGGQIVYSQPEFARGIGVPTVGYQGDRSHWKRGVPEDAQRRRRGGGEEM